MPISETFEDFEVLFCLFSFTGVPFPLKKPFHFEIIIDSHEVAQTFENKWWSELLKTHLGLGFTYLSVLEHLLSYGHDKCIQEMFVEMKSVGLSKLSSLFINR